MQLFIDMVKLTAVDECVHTVTFPTGWTQRICDCRFETATDISMHVHVHQYACTLPQDFIENMKHLHQNNKNS